MLPERPYSVLPGTQSCMEFRRTVISQTHSLRESMDNIVCRALGKDLYLEVVPSSSAKRLNEHQLEGHIRFSAVVKAWTLRK
ncbi:hypothetical protein PC116_g24120 [Phytophthora cactorum]|uniref:Uncharacterized protein n=1 Tax=Phytophthora cactorum TaxID=29920 RepID=A0A8T0Y894_9STRA|nr:hypothetical protein PC113_g18674 [Phytophthora cactorum]KAG2900241.1 hypothetical protein PC117_g22016 [Phytophthora cactorum]KAG2964761.1 hypothetical protein PC118_g20128 [Phytophthora cactorum]KAG4227492.1 hypothetical protein PC116_g24120 [Phytophthora cactorum]